MPKVSKRASTHAPEPEHIVSMDSEERFSSKSYWTDRWEYESNPNAKKRKVTEVAEFKNATKEWCIILSFASVMLCLLKVF